MMPIQNIYRTKVGHWTKKEMATNGTLMHGRTNVGLYLVSFKP